MTQRKKIIAGNWKMNQTIDDVRSFFNAVDDKCMNVTDREFIISPAFPHLAPSLHYSEGKNIMLAAQNFHTELKGAYTGEVGIEMLKDLSVNSVLIGHSERRHVFGEDLELIRKKVQFAQEHNMKVIFCIGETLNQRERQELYAVIELQISSAFDNNLKSPVEDIIIAYEPVWAIGTGVTASGEQAQEMHAFIRNYMKEKYDREDTRILYGGSVKPANIAELMGKEDIDGVLVGGASLTADSFLQIMFYDQ